MFYFMRIDLAEVFSQILRTVVKNQIISKLKQNDIGISNYENLFQKATRLKVGDLGDLLGFKYTVECIFGDIELCQSAKSLRCIIFDEDLNNLENGLDFSNEINCLIYVYNIFRFFESELTAGIYDGMKFDKNEKKSILIVRKMNLILNILIRCVESFSIEQELKENAKTLIKNTAKKSREVFLIHEKEDIENIVTSLKFRLNNILELARHNVLDEVISDGNIPILSEHPTLSFEKEKLTGANSEILNIVKEIHDSLSDYTKDSQFDIISQSSSNIDDAKLTELMEIFEPQDHQILNQIRKSKIHRKRPSKEKKINKRKSKSTKINHVPN